LATNTAGQVWASLQWGVQSKYPLVKVAWEGEEVDVQFGAVLIVTTHPFVCLFVRFVKIFSWQPIES
jgi:hypothetical protein